MVKYQVEVQTTVAMLVTVDAENDKDAREQGEAMFNNLPVPDSLAVDDEYKIHLKKLTDTTYEKQRDGTYHIIHNGEKIGVIEPGNSWRKKGWYTEVWLENFALADDSGFPNWYSFLHEAKSAVEHLLKKQADHTEMVDW